MRHYEIVLLIRPDQSDQLPAMLDRYKQMVIAAAGKVHRVEDWGRRSLVYMINKLSKAHYVCINIEINQNTLSDLNHAFKFNDAILRYLIVQKKAAETAPSCMMKGLTSVERPFPPQEAAHLARA